MPTPVLGKNCKLYRNTGTKGTPTWNEIENCRDLTLNLTFDESEVSVRGVGVKLFEPTMLDAPLEFEMVRDVADADQTALLTAFHANSAIDIAIAEGPIATAGTRYWRGYYKVTVNNHNEALAAAKLMSFTLKPSYDNVGESLIGVYTTPGS